MSSFRGVIILSGILVLGLLWGSFFWWYSSTSASLMTPIKLFIWSLLVANTFIITIRIWDAYFQHKDEVHL